MITLGAIGFIFKRAFYFVIDNWQIVLAVIVLAILGLWLRSCLSRPPKLDEKAIQKAQQAIAVQDREKMIEVLAESDTREDEIDSNIKAIENARENAKKNYTGLRNEDLAAELERRAKE